MTQGPPPLALTEMLRLLRGASITVFAQDAGLRYRWLENPPASWNAHGDVRGRTDGDLLPPGAAAAAIAPKRSALSTGRPHWAEFVIETRNARQYFELYVEPEKRGDGAVSGVIGLVLDVTERRRRVAALEAVVRQASHRSKNLLAILQSVAVHTVRDAASTEQFIEQYRGRIQSISRSQDIALGPSAHGARLPDLVAAQVEPYVAGAGSRVSFQGEDVELTANAALHIGLALSELAIASANHGALAGEEGQVAIEAVRAIDPETDSSEESLRLTWSETAAGRPVEPPEGFTRQLLERLIPAALGGRAVLTSTADRLSYVLTARRGEFE
jgi:two-component sensor histidine kinase